MESNVENTPAGHGPAGGSAASAPLQNTQPAQNIRPDAPRVISSSPLARIAAAARKKRQQLASRGTAHNMSAPTRGTQNTPGAAPENTPVTPSLPDRLQPGDTPSAPSPVPKPQKKLSFAALSARIAAAGSRPARREREDTACLRQEEVPAPEDADIIHPQQVRQMQESFAELSRPIVLIGPMAAGKTYIGTHLARFYGYEFLDADQLIVERYGEVSEIFEIFGEAHFRELEVKVIEEVLTSPAYRNTVFSLGGGAPMTDAVAQLLRGQNVVYILVDAPTVEPRITGSKTRPLLQPNPVQRWSEIFEHRRERYESLATYTLDARGARPIGVMAAEIQSFVLASRKENLKHDRG